MTEKETQHGRSPSATKGPIRALAVKSKRIYRDDIPTGRHILIQGGNAS
jgi:hypothetical protein